MVLEFIDTELEDSYCQYQAACVTGLERLLGSCLLAAVALGAPDALQRLSGFALANYFLGALLCCVPLVLPALRSSPAYPKYREATAVPLRLLTAAHLLAGRLLVGYRAPSTQLPSGSSGCATPAACFGALLASGPMWPQLLMLPFGFLVRVKVALPLQAACATLFLCAERALLQGFLGDEGFLGSLAQLQLLLMRWPHIRTLPLLQTLVASPTATAMTLWMALHTALGFVLPMYLLCHCELRSRRSFMRAVAGRQCSTREELACRNTIPAVAPALVLLCAVTVALFYYPAATPFLL